MTKWPRQNLVGYNQCCIHMIFSYKCILEKLKISIQVPIKKNSSLNVGRRITAEINAVEKNTGNDGSLEYKEVDKPATSS